MASQTISFNSLSYSFVSNLPKLTSEPIIEKGTKPLQGIQIPAKVKIDTSNDFEVPSKIKTSEAGGVDKQRNYGGGTLNGAVDANIPDRGAPSSNTQIESFEDDFTDLLVGKPSESLVAKGQEKKLTLQGTKTAPTVTAAVSKTFSDISQANKDTLKAPTNTVNAAVTLPTTTKADGPGVSDEVNNYSTPLQTAVSDKVVKTIEIKDAEGNSTGLAFVQALGSFSTTNKLQKAKDMKLLKKKAEEADETDFGKAYVKGSKNLSMFATWNDSAEANKEIDEQIKDLQEELDTVSAEDTAKKNQINKKIQELKDRQEENSLNQSFKIADDVGVFFATGSKPELLSTEQVTVGDGSEKTRNRFSLGPDAYGNDTTSFHFEWGDSTLGISDMNAEMLANSKMLGRGNYVTLKAMEDAKDWKEFGESFGKIFGSKTFWGEVLGSVTDAGIEWGKDWVKASLSNLLGGKEKMPNPSKYSGVVFGEGLTNLKDVDKDLLGNEPGFETKKSGKKLEKWNNGKETESSDYYLEKIGNTIVQVEKSVTTKKAEEKQKAGEKESWRDKNRSKVSDTIDAIVDKDAGIAGEFENAMISQIATQKHQIVDQSAAIREMVSQDPLLSQYQFDLQIPTTERKEKSNGSEETITDLSASMYQHNDTSHAYTNYRVKGITFPAYKRKVTDTHYGVHTLSTHTDLYASADHTATLTIIVDKKMEVLQKLITNVTGNGHVAAKYIDLSTVSSANVPNSATVATLQIRNGRDILKSIGMENPDWKLDQEQSIGTVQDKTGYDSDNINFDASADFNNKAALAKVKGNTEKAERLKEKANKAKKVDSTVKKTMVEMYNPLPKFQFWGFKIINLDYNFNFDTEGGNVFEIKATVTWSKAEIIMQPAKDIYYAAGLSTNNTRRLAEDAEKKAAKKLYEAELKSNKFNRKTQEKAKREAEEELKELKAAHAKAFDEYWESTKALFSTGLMLPSLQPVAQPANMFAIKFDPKIDVRKAVEDLAEEKRKAYADLTREIDEENKKLKEAQDKLAEYDAADKKSKEDMEKRLEEFGERYDWSSIKSKNNSLEPGEMLALRNKK